MRKWHSCVAIVFGTVLWIGFGLGGLCGRLAAQQDVPPPPPPAPDSAPALPVNPADQPPALVPAGVQPAPAAVPAPPADQSGVEVLTRGPLHEAFAEVIAYNPQPGQIVTMQPPAAVEEVPPTQKPAGNYLWIPGYWAYDQERNNYIWVSGVWRIAPPGTAWVPGYWNQVANGYQWTSGYWATASAATGAIQETEYLPPPPATLEAGASSPQPTVDHFWIPGYWRWNGFRYAWQAGYWGRAQQDWVWIPARYVWTPSGYVFIAGHWDYCMAQRGLAFCPVAFTAPVYAQAGYYYTPSVCIQTSLLTDYLFCRPSYCHYYFGDYYAPRYAGVSFGIYPAFGLGVRIGYEPCFVHDRWYYGRHDPHWEANLRVNYNYRVAHVEARPPQTWSASLRVTPGGRVAVMGAPLNHYAVAGHAPFHMETVSAERRDEYRKYGAQVHGAQAERRDMEIRAQAEHRAGQSNQSFRLKTPTASTYRGNVSAGHAETSAVRNGYGHPGNTGLQPVRPSTQPSRVDTTRTYHPGTTTTQPRDTHTVPAKDRTQRDKEKDYGGR